MTEMNRMLINYVPGVECRVAVVKGGRLEELHAERADNASHVGNIYVGKVMNVEPGIQAAFVDFGLEENGFLHITDVHPRYFPGEDAETTERVGLKTPRRERPPIQACLKRGQEVIVQVLKEGIGTKGPTLTSYLSVPGRFIVMMPQMDKVGVSRRVEDEEQRREMRAILDALDLPEGFGFILRTAGMDQTKTELKRDLAYLQRLWKDMQKRLESGSKPRLLYAESDLLVRALRDVLTPDIREVVVDDASAIRRAARFLKIVAPRTGPRLLHYADPCPIFHRFGIEDQIRAMNSREAPLPSGGSLVIDEAEALVAIDVNSGKMRDNRDAETTAFKTNMEAADEIARQLRLRDLGGVVINDFIDMRSRKNQKDLFERFNGNLKADRAHTKTLPISQFGIIEMTRQRMRGSHRKVHFAECPHCQGSGRLQRPNSVLADALRELAWLLHFDKVRKVEMAMAPRIAGEMLSQGRQRLSRLEHGTGKRVDVRVVESAAPDRVSFYAYDDKGDVDIESLRTPKPPEAMEVWVDPAREALDDGWAADPREESVALERLEDEAERAAMDRFEHADDDGDLAYDAKEPTEDWGELGLPLAKRVRGRRGGRGRGPREDQRPLPAPVSRPAQAAPAPGGAPGAEGEGGGRKRRRRRRRGKGGGEGQPMAGAPGVAGVAPRVGDSWDVDPAPGRAATQQPPRAPQGARGPQAPGRGDSWDIDPVAPAHRADSWDLEAAPAGGGARASANAPGDSPAQGAPVNGEGGRKRRRRRGRRGRGGNANTGMPAGQPGAGGAAHRDDVREPKAPAPMAPRASANSGDSWDLEPIAKPVAPPAPARAPAPARPAAPAKAPASPRPAVAVRSAAPAPAAGDSWDMDPVAPVKQPSTPARAAAPGATAPRAPARAAGNAPDRGDSWDVEPGSAGVRAAAPVAAASGAQDAIEEIAGAAPVKKKRSRRGGRGRTRRAAGDKGDAAAPGAGE